VSDLRSVLSRHAPVQYRDRSHAGGRARARAIALVKGLRRYSLSISGTVVENIGPVGHTGQRSCGQNTVSACDGLDGGEDTTNHGVRTKILCLRLTSGYHILWCLGGPVKLSKRLRAGISEASHLEEEVRAACGALAAYQALVCPRRVHVRRAIGALQPNGRECYFRREWRLAVERADDMSDRGP